MEAVNKEKNEHYLSVKVMRLTRPSLISPTILTTDYKDLPSSLNTVLKGDITSVPGTETIASSSFLQLPQCLGDIYLGETFSSYICIHNHQDHIVKDVTFRARIKTPSSKSIDMAPEPSTSVDLEPGESIDDTIRHEVKEQGLYGLICEVKYCSGNLSSEIRELKKLFQFKVLPPLYVKTNLSGLAQALYLEAIVTNVTTGPIVLQKVSLESDFQVEELHTPHRAGGLELHILPSHESKQFLYSMFPNEQTLNETRIGKLDIIWQSNLGQMGRLQTSSFNKPESKEKEITLSLLGSPSIVYLEEAFSIEYKLMNISSRLVIPELVLEDLSAISNNGLMWCATSGTKLNEIPPGSSCSFILQMIPLTLGLQNIEPCFLIKDLNMTDVINGEVSFKTYEFDLKSHVYVVRT